MAEKFGIGVAADALVTKTADGIDYMTIFEEIASLLEMWNTERSSVASLLTFRTVAPGEFVSQSNSAGSFEDASEFGIARASNPPPNGLVLSYTLKDKELRTAFTWKALRSMTSEQVRTAVRLVLDSDNRLVNGTVLQRLFDPSPWLSPERSTVYGLWNGTDGLVPPPHMGYEFTSDATHYHRSGAAVVDAQDLELMVSEITLKGYGTRPGSQLIILANPTEGEAIQGWRAGVESRPGGPKAKWDFVPSSNAPAWISAENIHGAIPPAEHPGTGLKVQGAYGKAWLIESNYIPGGYVAVVATGGNDSPDNVIGLREFPDSAWQGLRMIPGPLHPIQDHYYQRAFGVGVRHRGAASVLQVGEGSTYVTPTIAV